MNRINASLAELGAAGVLGLGVLLFCLPFYFSAIAPAERELGARREAAERLRRRQPFAPASTDPQAAELQRFYGLFPPLTKITDELEQVFALARDARLNLVQGEYRLERRGAGLARYQVSLPVHGTYAQVRAFVAAVLKEKPTVSVDALRFERKKAAETEIDAQVRLTLHFRPHDDAGEPQTRGTP